MQCPKCKQEVLSDQECPHCGVIFSKYRERLNNPRSSSFANNQMRGSYASPSSTIIAAERGSAESGIRRKGLLMFCVGTLGAIVVGFFHYWLNAKGYEFTLWGFVAFGVPGAYGIAGLLELITGTPFTHLASKWDGLKGWQRGVIGIVVVLACLGLLVGGLAIWGEMTK